MVVDPATRRSAFDALKAPPKAATLGRFKARLQHMADLDAVGPTEAWLRGYRWPRSGTSRGRRVSPTSPTCRR